jgi:hypothetical protein
MQRHFKHKGDSWHESHPRATRTSPPSWGSHDATGTTRESPPGAVGIAGSARDFTATWSPCVIPDFGLTPGLVVRLPVAACLHLTQ